MKLLLAKKKKLSIKQYVERRNDVLFVRKVGGLGDIFMHCMMFEDIKNTYPEIKIIFACPLKYMCVAQMHRYIDEVVDYSTVNFSDYPVYFDTSKACVIYEMLKAPYADKHRSDIWANHFGFELTNHNLNLDLPQEYKDFGKIVVKDISGDRPSVALCPYSAMKMKNLKRWQVEIISNHIRKLGLSIFILHNEVSKDAISLNIPTIHDITIPQWMGVVSLVDYVITVDSAAFYYAGGIGKPLMGIFVHADGKVYNKYFNATLVQKHRDNGDWDCGPCYDVLNCPKSSDILNLPCLIEINEQMLIEGMDEMFKKTPINTTLHRSKHVYS